MIFDDDVVWTDVGSGAAQQSARTWVIINLLLVLLRRHTKVHSDGVPASFLLTLQLLQLKVFSLMNLLFFYLDLLFDLCDPVSLHLVDLFLNFLEFLFLLALQLFNFLGVLVWLAHLDHDVIICLDLSKLLEFLSCHFLEAFLNLSLQNRKRE